MSLFLTRVFHVLCTGETHGRLPPRQNTHTHTHTHTHLALCPLRWPSALCPAPALCPLPSALCAGPPPSASALCPLASALVGLHLASTIHPGPQHMPPTPLIRCGFAPRHPLSLRFEWLFLEYVFLPGTNHFESLHMFAAPGTPVPSGLRPPALVTRHSAVS